jgi:hypothetical protein
MILFAGFASPPAAAEVSCHLINAKGVGKDLGNGTTTGRLIGGGLLQGTLSGSLTVTGVTGSVATFNETVTFTNVNGTLTVTVSGAIDLASGKFNALGPVTAAAGKLSGAAGNLFLSGAVDFESAAFSEDVNGFICADLAP